MSRPILTAGLAAALLGLASSAMAQATVPAKPLPAAPGVASLDAPLDPQAQIADLQRQLHATQQQLLGAQRDLQAAQEDLTRLRADSESLKVVREKNQRLVAIGEELIASYQRRYGRGRYLPFELGRRKFEAELQAMGDRVYENRADAVPPPPAAVPAASPSPK